MKRVGLSRPLKGRVTSDITPRTGGSKSSQQIAPEELPSFHLSSRIEPSSFPCISLYVCFLFVFLVIFICLFILNH